MPDAGRTNRAQPGQAGRLRDGSSAPSLATDAVPHRCWARRRRRASRSGCPSPPSWPWTTTRPSPWRSSATCASATARSTGSSRRPPGAEALRLLDELTLRDRSVALVLSDQRMPEMTGIEVLGSVRRPSPGAKLLLLTAYADTDVAIQAINDIGLDYYMVKPWDPPQERLYPVLDDLLGDWARENPAETSQVRVVGHRWSDRSYEVKTFLARNHVPYRWLDVERDEEARRLVDLAGRGHLRPAARARPRRRGAPDADHPRGRGGAGAAHPRRAAAVRPVHRRQRPGRSGRGGLRGVGGPADRRGRARRPRRAGRPERVDRELPRLPQGALGRRPHPPRGGPGRPVRRRDGAGARRRRAHHAGPRARGGPGGRRRDRGAGGAASPPVSRTAGSRPRGSPSSAPAASTTAPRRARRSSARGRTSTSSARPTRPARPC